MIAAYFLGHHVHAQPPYMTKSCFESYAFLITGVPRGELGVQPPLNLQIFLELYVCKICCPSSAPVLI